MSRKDTVRAVLKNDNVERYKTNISNASGYLNFCIKFDFYSTIYCNEIENCGKIWEKDFSHFDISTYTIKGTSENVLNAGRVPSLATNWGDIRLCCQKVCYLQNCTPHTSQVKKFFMGLHATGEEVDFKREIFTITILR